MKESARKKITEEGRLLRKYAPEKYGLTQSIRELFNCYDLTRIHEIYKSDFDVLTFETDQSTIFHKKFYAMDKSSQFYKSYVLFIQNEIRPLFDEKILYQKIPTFRTQVPNNLGVAEWHKDSDYNHAEEEWNIFLPLTKAYDTNTIWAESKPGKEDYTPMNAEVGDYYFWQGSKLMHGNKTNDTKKSRVSIDFRVMPYSHYKENDRTSTSNKTKMTIGHYFEICE